MFTGIVTHVGEVAAVREIAGGRELVVASRLPLAEVALGASVAHSGTCLTVVAKDATTHTVQASAETLARTASQARPPVSSVSAGSTSFTLTPRGAPTGSPLSACDA